MFRCWSQPEGLVLTNMQSQVTVSSVILQAFFQQPHFFTSQICHLFQYKCLWSSLELWTNNQAFALHMENIEFINGSRAKLIPADSKHWSNNYKTNALYISLLSAILDFVRKLSLREKFLKNSFYFLSQLLQIMCPVFLELTLEDFSVHKLYEATTRKPGKLWQKRLSHNYVVFSLWIF